MRPTPGQLSGRNSGGSSRFAKSVASTIATSAERPDPATSPPRWGPLVRPLAAHLGLPSTVGRMGLKRLTVLPPTRYRRFPGVPWPVAEAPPVVNQVKRDFGEGQRTRCQARRARIGWQNRAASGSRRPAPPLPPPSGVVQNRPEGPPNHERAPPASSCLSRSSPSPRPLPYCTDVSSGPRQGWP